MLFITGLLACSSSSVAVGADPLARCGPQWIFGGGIAGTDLPVNACVFWDPDGPGPLTKRLIVGGEFTLADSLSSRAIAEWDGEQWQALGAVPSGPIISRVNALATLPNGELVVAGAITRLGSPPIQKIARWNGTQWLPLGTGVLGAGIYEVRSVLVTSAGDLIAGGTFSYAGSLPALNVARWDGTAWSPLGAGLDGVVHVFAEMPNGDVLAGGSFRTEANSPITTLARWDGNAWQAIPDAPSGSGAQIRSMEWIDDHRLVVGGEFTQAGSTAAHNIAMWDGTNWSALDEGVDGDASPSVRVLKKLKDGTLLVAGTFEIAGSITVKNTAAWDGAHWRAFRSVTSSATGVVSTVAVDDAGATFIGGQFEQVDGVRALNICGIEAGGAYSLQGNGWGLNELVGALAVLPDGGLLAGGNFTSSATSSLPYRGVWNGRAWQVLGAVPGSYVGSVTDLVVSERGRIYGIGSLASFGGPFNELLPSELIGTTWRALGVGKVDPGSPFVSGTRRLALLKSGELVAAGTFIGIGGTPANNIAKWDGAAWVAMGNGLTGPSGNVAALAVAPNGDLVAGGSFTKAGDEPASNIAIWSGTNWSPLGSGLNGSVTSLAISPSGNILVGGTFTLAGDVAARSVAEWDGSRWRELGEGLPRTVRAVSVLPDGRYVASHSTSASSSAPYSGDVQVWDGQDWRPLGGGFPAFNALVRRQVVLPNGDIVFGGDFRLTEASRYGRIARWTESNSPWIARAPVASVGIRGSKIGIEVSPAVGYPNVSFQWQRETTPGVFIDVINGVGGSSGVNGSGAGGTVSGASGSLPAPTDGTPATLTITNATPADTGNYKVLFWNTCGEVESVAVKVTVKGHAADINGDGIVDDDDFTLFAIQYDAMLCSDPAMTDGCSADFNSDGQVDDADFNILAPAYNVMVF